MVLGLMAVGGAIRAVVNGILRRDIAGRHGRLHGSDAVAMGVFLLVLCGLVLLPIGLRLARMAHS